MGSPMAPVRAAFELNFLADTSEESLLTEVRRVAALVPSERAFTKSVYNASSPKVSSTTLRRRFGDWHEVLRRAGIGHRYSGLIVTEKMKQAPKSYSDNDLIEELRRVHATVGKEHLTLPDFRAYTAIDPNRFYRRFGSFHRALEIARVPRFPKQGKEFSEEECFENIANLWIHYGRIPQYRETLLPPSEILAKTYVTRWGTWRQALIAFVEWSKTDQTPIGATLSSPQSAKGPGPNPRPKKSEADCRDVRPGLKWQVCKRDNFRCVACGRSPATHAKVELHADHIIAVANGGKTVLENLQALCQDCNLGKGKSQ